ncbi:MAG: hypothetical protein V1874_17610 [Spirochaetota bacterium]
MKRVLVLFLILAVSAINPFYMAGAEDANIKMQKIADQLAEIGMMGGDRLGYAGEILDHLKKNHNITPNQKYHQRYSDRRSLFNRPTVDGYSLLSGGLAIRESIQTGTIRPSSYTAQDVEISKLTGPEIKSHPFKEMYKGKKPKLSELDKYCPENFYYLHFNNMTKSLDFFDYLGKVGGSLHKRFTPQSADFMLKEKILTQLALKENKAARKFYNLVIREMAITGSDPFIIEGSDVTLIFRLKHDSVFNSTINDYRKFFREESGAGSEDVTIGGIKANRVYTEDNRINSYLAYTDPDTAVISNSAKALEAVILTAAKKNPSMAEADDYIYMRTIYPAEENEDGFIYLSDSFIRRLVGPELRIKEARRMNEALRVAKLERYIIFYYQLNKKYPQTMEDIHGLIARPSLTKKQEEKVSAVKNDKLYKTVIEITSQTKQDKQPIQWQWYNIITRLAEKLNKENPKAKDNKEKANSYAKLMVNTYKDASGEEDAGVTNVLDFFAGKKQNKPDMFDGLGFYKNSFTAFSKLYGRQGFMKPNIDKELKYASKEEAESYKRFSDEYCNFWRDYFDPIGVRFKLDDGISVETCILPLINNSIYEQVTAIIGGAPIDLHAGNTVDGEIMGLLFKLNTDLLKEAMPEALTSHRQQEKSELNKLLIDKFKNEIQLHVLDTVPLADFDSSGMMTHFMSSRINEDAVAFGFLAWTLFHPLRLSIPFKEQANVDDIRNFIKIIFSDNMPREMSYSFYNYEYKSRDINVLKITILETITFRIFIAIHNNNLEIATTEDYMKRIIDSGKSKYDKNIEQGNIMAVYRPAEMKLERSSYEMSILESAQSSSFKNFGTIKLLDTLFPGEKDIAQKSLEVFGFKPLCPMGGVYTIDAKTGKVRNSVFGDLSSPYIKADEIKSDILTRFFSTKDIKIKLEFTKEGIKTKIITQ